MASTANYLDILACPQCEGNLQFTKEEVLFCIPCRLCFPVEEGVPDLSIESALSLAPDGSILPKQKNAIFMMVKGRNEGMKIRIDQGSCIIVGRYMDADSAQVFNLDFSMSLDENAKQLIKNYLSKITPANQKKLKSDSIQSIQGQEIGPYHRSKDVLIDDPDVSRVHAMIFFDESGAGILDLVSRTGTYVNGQEVEAIRLKSGDRINLGKTEFIYECS